MTASHRQTNWKREWKRENTAVGVEETRRLCAYSTGRGCVTGSIRSGFWLDFNFTLLEGETSVLGSTRAKRLEKVASSFHFRKLTFTGEKRERDKHIDAGRSPTLLFSPLPPLSPYILRRSCLQRKLDRQSGKRGGNPKSKQRHLFLYTKSAFSTYPTHFSLPGFRILCSSNYFFSFIYLTVFFEIKF